MVNTKLNERRKIRILKERSIGIVEILLVEEVVEIPQLHVESFVDQHPTTLWSEKLNGLGEGVLLGIHQVTSNDWDRAAPSATAIRSGTFHVPHQNTNTFPSCTPHEINPVVYRRILMRSLDTLSRMRTCRVINSYTVKEKKKRYFLMEKIWTTRIHNVRDAQTLQLLFIKCAHDRANI